MTVLLAVPGLSVGQAAEGVTTFANVNLVSMTSAQVLPEETALIKGGTMLGIGDDCLKINSYFAREAGLYTIATFRKALAMDPRFENSIKMLDEPGK